VCIGIHVNNVQHRKSSRHIGIFGKGEIVAIPPEQCYPGFEYFIIIQKVGANFRKYSSEFQLLMPLALHILPMAGVLDL
jgi:hypothetical protein